MRGGLSGAGFLLDNNQFVGVCLGADFCAEHEWGIKNLQSDYKLKLDKLGFEACKVRRFPDEFLKLMYQPEITYLVHMKPWQHETRDNNYERVVTADFYDKKKDLICAWDESSFGIRVRTDQGKSYLQELYDAFKCKDAAIWLGSRPWPIGNAGLTLCIYSRIPQQAKDIAITKSKDRQRLRAAATKTGIEERLKNVQKNGSWMSRCSYHALSPRWTPTNMKHRTKYCVMWWLNPCDQESNEAGWFTTEELDQWIAGHGPICKKRS